MDRYVGEIVTEVMADSKKPQSLTEAEQEDAFIIISSEVKDYLEMSGEFKYGDRDKIVELVKQSIENLDRNPKIEFSEEYLIGKLVNVLKDDGETEEMISSLSMLMTDKPFSTFWGGRN